MNKAFNQVKSNITKSKQFSEILSLKEIFDNGEEDDTKSNNRTKN